MDPGGQGRNRTESVEAEMFVYAERIKTVDTWIFSIQLRLSTEFSIDLYALIEVRFWSTPLTLMFCVYRSECVFFSAYLHRNYT